MYIDKLKRIFLRLEIISPFAQLPASAATGLAMDYSFVFSRALGGSFLAQLLGDIMGNAFAQGYLA